MMLKNEDGASKRKDILSIQLAGHRLFGQIEDILGYMEIDTGKLQAAEEAYIISSLLNDITNGEQLVEKANGLELIVDIDPGLPSVILGDGRQIKKILKHLIDNAVKITKKGLSMSEYTLLKKNMASICVSESATRASGLEKNILEILLRLFFNLTGEETEGPEGWALDCRSYMD